jgi:hypothetical protein
MTDNEQLKGQVTALQNVLSIVIAAHPNADGLKNVIQEVARQVAPTLGEAHPSFRQGWASVIAAVCQLEEPEPPAKDGQH